MADAAETVTTETEAEEMQIDPGDASRSIIRNYTLGGMATTIIPSPMIDLAALTAVQLKMLHSLSNAYGIPFSKDIARSAIGSLVAGSLPVATTRIAASALKAIPVVGHWVAMATMPILAGASTYAIGKVFNQHFASGGTFLTFNPEKVRAYYEEALKEGKQVASDISANDSANT